VNVFFEHWRNAEPGSAFRHRMEGLLASVDRTLLTDELERVRSRAADVAVAADAQRALAECKSWERLSGVIQFGTLRRIRAEALARRHQAISNLRNASPRELIEILGGGDDPAVRGAAATIAAERGLALADEILDSLLRHQRSDDAAMAGALVSLTDNVTAVSKLVERSLEKEWRVGSFASELLVQLDPRGELSDALRKEIKRLGGPDNLNVAAKRANDDATTIWTLRPGSYSEFQPRYEIRASSSGGWFYDCNVAPRAFSALTNIPGDASLVELQRAVEHEDGRVRDIARGELAKRSVTELAERGDAAGLLRELRSARSREFISRALSALGAMRGRDALSLVDDLLVIQESKLSEVHQAWQPSNWADAIHRTLARLGADDDVRQKLDNALASDSPETQAAALSEFSRWFAENLEAERNAMWTSGDRIQQILALAVSSPIENVRIKAAEALKHVDFALIKTPLLEKLSDSSSPVQLAAANVLVLLKAEEQYGRVTDSLLHTIKTETRPDLRRQAGGILGKIPGGVEPFYKPIQAALTRKEPERALQLIESALETIPADVDLMWWRGHALRALGRLEDAAQSFEKAYELGEEFSVIPQALAETLMQVEQFPRAMEAARGAVKIAPHDSDAQATLAWSSYKASAIPDAVEAADKAVALDPVHALAIWVAVLGHLRQPNPEKARVAFQHALRARQVLSPGFDNWFVPKFLEELDGIDTGLPGIAPLVEEIKLALKRSEKNAAI
jgi:tetratricopeptide (TPR) repeat protein